MAQLNVLIRALRGFGAHQSLAVQCGQQMLEARHAFGMTGRGDMVEKIIMGDQRCGHFAAPLLAPDPKHTLAVVQSLGRSYRHKKATLHLVAAGFIEMSRIGC